MVLIIEQNCYSTIENMAPYLSAFHLIELSSSIVFRSTITRKIQPFKTTNDTQSNINEPRDSIIIQRYQKQYSDDLIRKNRSKYNFVIEPIPPTLESICSKDKASCEHSKSVTQVYDIFKKTIDLSIPYTENELRLAANNSKSISTAHTCRNRSEFYAADPLYKTFKSPLLMDGFTYCEGSALIVEAIFNLKYLNSVHKKQRKLVYIKDTWLCTHKGMTVKSNYPRDPHQHIIIAVFNFSNQCSTAHDNHYEFRAVKSKFHYSLNLEYLPYFRLPRYYLSMCIFLSKAIEQQVIAFINYYFFHGVQHFVFNINGNLNYWKKLLKEYSDHGIVDIIDFEFPNNIPFNEQQVVMNSCNRRYRYTTRYMIQCDVDEFFLPLNPKWRIIDVVRLYSSAYPNIDAFSVFISLLFLLNRFAITSSFAIMIRGYGIQHY